MAALDMLTVRVDPQTKTRLKDLAYRRRITVTALLLELVERELKNDEEEL